MPDKPKTDTSEPKQQRLVRVFISSTFRDMHAERDELVKFVFPELRRRCRERQVEFVEVDLRWGITEEESNRGQVLPLCLEEIKRCKPYFIGLLGERYGWVPDKIPQELIEREPWLKEHPGTTGKSVTELEILHGVLNNSKMAEHAFFYFRDPAYIKSIPADKQKDFTAEDAEDAEKLRRLKEKIRGSRQPVREKYPDPKKLGELIREDLWKVIDKKFPLEGVPTALERERMDHEAFAVARQKVYIGREAYFKRLDEHAASTNLPLVVLGESGSGKSALIANWARKYREGHPDDFMVFHYIGGTVDSADYAKILRRIMEEIQARYEPKEKGKEGDKERPLSTGPKEDEIPTDPKKVVEQFPLWLAKAAARGRFILVLDALNQLEDKDNAPDLGWLPQFFPENVRVILSTLTAEKERDVTAEDAEGAKGQVWRRQYDALKRRGWQTVQVELLTREERKRLIEEYLDRFARKLSTKTVDKIIAARQTANPLYLKALLDELRVYGDHDTLGQRIDHYLEAMTIDALYEKILERYEGDYEHDRKGLVRDVMSPIWASRRGLSEAELLELLGNGKEPMPRAYWSPLYLAAEESLVSRSGLLNFFHDYLRKAVEDRYLRGKEQKRLDIFGIFRKRSHTIDKSLCDKKQKRLAHLQLADYFEKKPLDARKMDELPWLLCQAEERNRLRACLLDIDQFDLIRERDQNELMGYWVWLREEREMGKSYRESFETWSGKPGRQDLHISYAANQLATFLLHAALHAEAEPLMCRALKIDEQSFGENHPRVATHLGNLAQLLKATNRLAEAEPLMRRALKIDEQSFGENHPRVAIDLNNLAQLLKATNRLAEAEPLSRRMVEIFLKFTRETGHPHPHLDAAVNNYARLLQAMGRSTDDIRGVLEKLYQRFGLDLGGVGGQANAEPSPKLRAVIEQLKRDPSKAEDIFKKLQREDPALLKELIQLIQRQKNT